MSESHKNPSAETRRKISEAMKNPSEETRRKISDAMKGKPHSEEHRRKIGEGNKGRTSSEKQRRSMSKACKGTITALNIETGIVERIPQALYHARRDIYFNPRSKVFREWKLSQDNKEPNRSSENREETFGS